METSSQAQDLSSESSSLVLQAIPLILPPKANEEAPYPFVSMGTFDARTRLWSDPTMEPDDFGDYLCFVFRFAQLYDKPDIMDWVISQFFFAKQHLTSPEGLYSSWRIGHPYPCSSFWKTHRLYEHMDLILGWNLLYRLTQSEEILQGAIDVADSLIQVGQSRHGYFVDSLWTRFQLPLTKLIKPEINGIFAEELVILFEFTQQEKYLEAARVALTYFFQKASLKKSGLFPDGYLPYLMLSWKTNARFMKTQTNMVQACLRFYETTHEQIFADDAHRLCQSIAKYQQAKGGFPHKINVKTAEISHPEILLTQNFAIIDIFLQAYLVLKDSSFLDIATNCAEWWLQYQSPLGLIPEEPLSSKKTNKMDQNADFSVSLLKLFQICSKPSYQQKAKQILKGLNQYHRVRPESLQSGFAKSVHVETGDITNNFNETKYLGGFLKGLLAFDEIQRKGSLIADPILKDIYRDR